MSNSSNSIPRLKKYFKVHYDTSITQESDISRIGTHSMATKNYSNNALLLEHPNFGDVAEDNPIQYFLSSPRIPDSKTFSILKFWNGYFNKDLAKMAQEILCIPASSANVERFFSTARTLDRFNRQQMTSETKARLLLCKSWWKLYISINKI